MFFISNTVVTELKFLHLSFKFDFPIIKLCVCYVLKHLPLLNYFQINVIRPEYICICFNLTKFYTYKVNMY